ncbi:MAG TPA: M50 family metallopeptidase [Phototrophicaceae bacterium]|nr:M50 family metallopeptidase [Phototrophicaceae bacterium]
MLTHLALFRQRALMIALIAFVIVFVLWNVPQLGFILYPIRLFVTFVHESGHGLAAIISGGRFVNLTVFADGSGVALTAGGSPLLILPAGYLGAALFGAVLFYLVNTVPFPRTISLVLAILVAIITLAFTSFLSTAWLVGLGMALVLVLLWRVGDRSVNLLVLDVLAILTGLNAVLDLLTVITHPDIALGTTRNDAAAFSAAVAPIIPGVIWALLWALLAVIMLGAAVYFSHIRRRTIL